VGLEHPEHEDEERDDEDGIDGEADGRDELGF